MLYSNFHAYMFVCILHLDSIYAYSHVFASFSNNKVSKSVDINEE